MREGRKQNEKFEEKKSTRKFNVVMSEDILYMCAFTG